MCFRKLQSWNLSTSTAEFCQFEKDAEISREESQFVEAFRGEIEIPPVIPKWLWQARIFVLCLPHIVLSDETSCKANKGGRQHCCLDVLLDLRH
jgi:hypothetical protein